LNYVDLVYLIGIECLYILQLSSTITSSRIFSAVVHWQELVPPLPESPKNLSVKTSGAI